MDISESAMVNSRDEGDFSCAVEACESRFDSMRGKKIHESRQHITCDIEGCKAVFDSQLGLERHQEDHEYPCGVDGCERVFETPHDRSRHKINDHDFQPCTVDECNRIFETVQGRRIHESSQHYPCEIEGCEAVLPSETELERHIDEHEFPCEVDGCEEVFETERGRTIHRTKSHEFSCDDCDDVFDSEHALKVHVGKKHNPDSSVPTDGVEDRFEGKRDYPDQEYLAAIDEIEDTSTSAIADYVGCDRRTALKRLEALEEQGRVEHFEIGRVRAYFWKLSDDD